MNVGSGHVGLGAAWMHGLTHNPVASNETKFGLHSTPSYLPMDITSPHQLFVWETTGTMTGLFQILMQVF